MSVEVIKPGLLSIIQDLGRVGFQKYGVIKSGAMDLFALRVANLFVGNHENEAAIEMTMIGPTLYFQSDALIAICGGDLSPRIAEQSVPLWRAVFVKKGSVLTFGHARSGLRAYLAFAGGLDLPSSMGSRSTYLRAEIGGFHGRPLHSGDRLHVRKSPDFIRKKLSALTEKGSNDHFLSVTRSVFGHIRPGYSQHPVIRCIRGANYDWFDEESQASFFRAEFQVQPESDRMGYRLTGTTLQLSQAQEMISEAVTFGTVQVPADGNPIVLMADHQTTGGYPKIAQVISVDLPVMAQLRPGAKVRFTEVNLDVAQRLYLEREVDIEWLQQGIWLEYYQI